MVWFWKKQSSPPQPADDAALPPPPPVLQSPASASSSVASPLPETKPATPPSPVQHTLSDSARAKRQLGLFFGGWIFLALSMRVARRAVSRRYRATVPKYYVPNTESKQTFSGPLEAAEALYVATLNVASFAMIMAGGTMWAWDIEGLEDLRYRLRSHLYRDREEKSAEEAAQAAKGVDTVDVMAAIVQHEEEERIRKEEEAAKTNAAR